MGQLGVSSVRGADGMIGRESASKLACSSTVIASGLEADASPELLESATTPSEPIGCTEADRHGAPTLAADWSTEKWPDRVLACGKYEVMPLGDGWLGWFNAAEEGDVP